MDSLSDLDDVFQLPLVVTTLDVVNAREQILIVRDGKTRDILDTWANDFQHELFDKEKILCQLLHGDGLCC